MKLREFYELDWSSKDHLPPEYDTTFAERTARIEKVLQPLMKAHEANKIRVLDASCGDGSFTTFFRKIGTDLTALDITQNATSCARRINPDVEFAVGSVEEGLPFRCSSFDVVWFGETLAHLFDGHHALGEFNRVLKPTGQLILTTPYHGLLKNLAIACFAFDKHFYPDNYRLRFYNRKSLEASLRWAGFKICYCTGIGRYWPLWKSFFVVAIPHEQPGPPPDRLKPR